ncbi:MAG: response regulator [Chloroflexi bacterium]|nr:response regulator [Chloroflexota bacterium]
MKINQDTRPLGKPLALIIEDNEDQNLVFTTALEQAGYATESIRDGLIAQGRLSEVIPTVIVLDLHLPGVDGEKLLKQIRGDKRLAETRIILATADALLASVLQSQGDFVFLKPISFSQLRQLATRFNRSSN